MLKPAVAVLGTALLLAGCQDGGGSARSRAPIPTATLDLMQSKGMSQRDPILIRSYKKESEMEVWKMGSNGRYTLLKTYPICRWSGQLGPKVREGDRQAPEGFYSVTPSLMNPNSSYYLSFDTGFPNAFDRSKGRTGSNLMVHGSCSSRGCFAMTDEAIAEIYAIAREAFAGGQRSFQFQSYPFRMTAKNMALHRADPNIGFWKNLKEGSDYFEVKHQEPKVAVCAGRYSFNSSGTCSNAFDAAVAQKSASDEREIASLVNSGTKAVNLVYGDGSQHSSFRGFFAKSTGPEVSRPELLASGPREVVVTDGPSTTASLKKDDQDN
ncbi:murein L,D-transpeptidase family protein [Microvirga sp. W0021]|uniref:Murein L,D-transpeptidase family protein n=1 Tax=Hohaiivirga grylli TaxID=3133970 RepID=A0ABV0BN47_9HYPH